MVYFVRCHPSLAANGRRLRSDGKSEKKPGVFDRNAEHFNFFLKRQIQPTQLIDAAWQRFAA